MPGTYIPLSKRYECAIMGRKTVPPGPGQLELGIWSTPRNLPFSQWVIMANLVTLSQMILAYMGQQKIEGLEAQPLNPREWLILNTYKVHLPQMPQNCVILSQMARNVHQKFDLPGSCPSTVTWIMPCISLQCSIGNRVEQTKYLHPIPP